MVCVGARTASATELRKDTAAAYDRYLAATEKRIAAEAKTGPFLFVDGWPEARRAAAYEQLRQGAVLIQEMNALEGGRPIAVEHGLIHDWVGVLFIPHTTLAQTLKVVQDYPHYQDYFKPQIRNSRLLSRNGDDFKVAMQIYRKTVVTVAIDAEFDVRFEPLGPERMMDRSCATRLAQVADVDQPDQHELEPGDGDGYLWRLCDFWRFEERDGGVYMQLESIGLSRGVPVWIAWLVDPLLKSIPRAALGDLLKATRRAVEQGQVAGDSEQGVEGRWRGRANADRGMVKGVGDGKAVVEDRDRRGGSAGAGGVAGAAVCKCGFIPADAGESVVERTGAEGDAGEAELLAVVRQRGGR